MSKTIDINKVKTMRLWQRKSRKGKPGGWYVTFARGVHQSLGTDDEGVAKDIFKDLQKEYLKGKLIRLEKGELKQFGTFKDEYLATRVGQKPNTYRADKLVLNKFQEWFGNRTMAAITPQKLATFRAFLKKEGKVIKDKQGKGGKVVGRAPMKETGCNSYLRHLKVALKVAQQWKYISKDINLRDHLKLFREDHRQPVYMTRNEVIHLLEIAGEDPVMRTPIAIQVYTGMSRAEIIEIMTISEDAITYDRVKTGKKIRVPIAEGLRPYISHLLPGIHKVFPWKNPRTYSRYFERVVAKAELHGISPHKVRHTVAAHLIQDGENLKTISEILGHGSIMITAEFYAHITDEEKKKAVNRLDYSSTKKKESL